MTMDEDDDLQERIQRLARRRRDDLRTREDLARREETERTREDTQEQKPPA